MGKTNGQENTKNRHTHTELLRTGVEVGMTAREDTIERIERVLKLTRKESITVTIPRLTAERAVSMLKEQETEIRQLRLTLDIAKGTCKGIESGGGQFADMPTMQYAT